MSASPKSESPKSARPKPRKPKPGDHIFLVDGSSYIFRAYHALPPLNRKSDGLQLNAVFGFCNMLWKLLRDMQPDERPTHLAVVFDKSERTFRTDLYPQYKAHRPDPPDDLVPQFAIIRAAVQAFDIPSVEQAGFEADDLIATYARQASEAGATVTIVASDKDLMQLVNERVVMYDTMKDRKIGRAEVIEKFGVPPEKVIDVQALIGDSTDNVPGVPGIGVKTAAQLIGEYGDLDTLLQRAVEIKQEKRRQALVENAEKARLSRTLVTLDDHVALETPLSDIVVRDPDPRRLIAFLKAMEFNTLTRRVAEATGADPAKIEPDARQAASGAGRPAESPQAAAKVTAAPEATARGRGAADGDMTPQALATARAEAARNAKIDRSRYETVRTLDRLQAWIDRARDVGFIAIDTEATSLDPMQAELRGFSLAVEANEACYVPLSHREGSLSGRDGLFAGDLATDQLEEQAALAALKPLLEDASVLKIGQNVKFDWLIF
ncbi:MAG: DNA polymerase I, partial [Bradyrhizobiaceae bacterium]|nr:DNA polymerase I [Bradyrhizobiaceae bacterium]